MRQLCQRVLVSVLLRLFRRRLDVSDRRGSFDSFAKLQLLPSLPQPQDPLVGVHRVQPDSVSDPSDSTVVPG